ncbi:MAG: putative porin [Marinilabiliaceae bacterium]|nr:putative porin [Marinilabiliaceae bacterium]
MKIKIIALFVALLWFSEGFGQPPSRIDQTGGRFDGAAGMQPGSFDRDTTGLRSQTTIISTIPREVRNWKLSNLFSRADSLQVDTLPEGFQVHNPAYQQAITNVQLGNIGAPWKAAMVSEMPIYSGFLFTETVRNFFTTPDEWKYYNTRTPYTNIYYQHAPPKSRSEENVGILFTQNVNKDWNVGVEYKVISSIGKYAYQTVNNRNFRFFSSYSGEIYQICGSFVYNKADRLENGGMLDDFDILDPEISIISRPEQLQVKFQNNRANNRVDNYQLFLDNKLEFGNVSVTTQDGETTKLPIGTAMHTLHIDRSRRVFQMDGINTDLGRYYPKMLVDSIRTRDSTYYTSITNIVQLKLNEEANSMLRFGLRGFIGNQYERYKYPAHTEYYKIDSIFYHRTDTTFVSSFFGGQIFKNIGETFRWNAGIKIYFQGYKAGDSEITGGFDSQFRIWKDTAGVFTDGGIFLISPNFFTENYYSNHFEWHNNFSAVKTVKLRGGIRIPTRKLELTAEYRLISDYVYWGQQALPIQTSAIVSLMEFKLYKHFKLWNLHSKNTALYQLTSHSEIIPLPMFSIYNSSYFQNTLFKVLFFQLGLDIRYNTAWYAPAYEPAVSQFYIQRERKVGDYIFADAFLNLHLKRARAFFKMTHVNQGLWGNNYFHTIGYPANPRSFRFGISWNFYD